MQPTFNRSEIFALAHRYRKESLAPGYRPKTFADCLRRAWAEAKKTMASIKFRMAHYGERPHDYASSFIVVNLPWSRYEEFRTGLDARKMVPMPEPMAQWFEKYGTN